MDPVLTAVESAENELGPFDDALRERMCEGVAVAAIEGVSDLDTFAFRYCLALSLLDSVPEDER